MSLTKSTGAIVSISIVWMFYLFSYVARIEPSVLVSELMADFKITSSTVGMVIATMYMPYVLLQVPCGIITDKLGVKKIIIISSTLCALGTFIFGSATEVFHLQIGRFLIGASAASAFICCGKIAGEFDKRKYSMLMGIAMCMGCCGGIAGTAPTAYMVSHIGWRNATFVISAIGILLAVIALLCIKTTKTIAKKENNSTRLLSGLKILFLNPKAWILGLYGAFTYLPLSAMAELWGVPFMELRYNVSTETAALSSIFIFVGFGLGGVVSAYIAEKINSYRKTIIMFTVGLVFAFSIALYSDSIAFFACLVLMFLGGLFAGANTLAFTIAFNLVPKEYSATSTGFLNALVMTSGIIFQPLLGKLLDFFRNGVVTSDGLPIYNIGMYRSAFQVVIVCMFIAIILTFFINDVKHAKSDE